MKLEAQPWKVFVVCLGSDLVRVQLSVLIYRVWAQPMDDGASGRVGAGEREREGKGGLGVIIQVSTRYNTNTPKMH